MMATIAGSKMETRKQWVAPELKKIDIERITANNRGPGSDSGSHSS